MILKINMETVTESTKLKVGKFYLVNCAKVATDNKEIYYVPIIGIYHKDPQFGVAYPHYHVDGRFASPKNVSGLKNGRTNTIFTSELVDNKYWIDTVIGTEYRKLKCKRLVTGIATSSSASKYWKWYKTMIGKSCAGKRCPHLGTLMHERKGKLVCPLHNLIGDKKTEKIILE